MKWKPRLSVERVSNFRERWPICFYVKAGNDNGGIKREIVVPFCVKRYLYFPTPSTSPSPPLSFPTLPQFLPLVGYLFASSVPSSKPNNRSCTKYMLKPRYNESSRNKENVFVNTASHYARFLLNTVYSVYRHFGRAEEYRTILLLDFYVRFCHFSSFI